MLAVTKQLLSQWKRMITKLAHLVFLCSTMGSLYQCASYLPQFHPFGIKKAPLFQGFGKFLLFPVNTECRKDRALRQCKVFFFEENLILLCGWNPWNPAHHPDLRRCQRSLSRRSRVASWHGFLDEEPRNLLLHTLHEWSAKKASCHFVSFHFLKKKRL